MSDSYARINDAFDFVANKDGERHYAHMTTEIAIAKRHEVGRLNMFWRDYMVNRPDSGYGSAHQLPLSSSVRTIMKESISKASSTMDQEIEYNPIMPEESDSLTFHMEMDSVADNTARAAAIKPPSSDSRPLPVQDFDLIRHLTLAHNMAISANNGSAFILQHGNAVKTTDHQQDTRPPQIPMEWAKPARAIFPHVSPSSAAAPAVRLEIKETHIAQHGICITLLHIFGLPMVILVLLGTCYYSAT